MSNNDSGEEEEDFDKEASCFKSFKEKITRDVFIKLDNLLLKQSPKEMKEKNEENIEDIPNYQPGRFGQGQCVALGA